MHRFRVETTWLQLLLAVVVTTTGRLSASEKAQSAQLSSRNGEVPFCYLRGSTRQWPIIQGNLGPDVSFGLSAQQGNDVIASGERLAFSGLTISVTSKGRLSIESEKDSDSAAFQLSVSLSRSGKLSDQQTLNVRPAPPHRPISYVSDLVDDLIRIFYDSKSGRFRPIEKSGFDQYFRRLQAQGIMRLIVWQSPFPFMADPKDHSDKDWSRYKQQTRAILDSEELTAAMRGPKLQSWKWMRMTMALRLMPEFGEMLAQSAAEHGIKLTASFRPFEPALTKYYEVPAFDAEGRWLWGFLPAAWPAVNYHPEELCFANQRTILKKMGRVAEADPASIELTHVENAKEFAERVQHGKSGLRIVASHFAPIADDSFVLVGGVKGGFALKRYRDIAKHAKRHQLELSDFTVSIKGDTVRIAGLHVPADYRFLIISRREESDEMPLVTVGHPIIVRSRAGNRIGRVNVYRVLDASDPDAASTRVAGITPDGMYRTTFQAIENSIDRLGAMPDPKRLSQITFVVDLGADWSVEMLDFQRPGTRQIAVTQLNSFLKHPAFDEIFINTRSHCQLAATEADAFETEGGIERLEKYRLKRQPYRHLGIDRASAPISLASNKRMMALTESSETIEQITTWQDDEWEGPCQSSESPFVWRYQRNRAVADGLRQLFVDLEREFPGVRIRAVIPPNESVIRTVQTGLNQMPKPDGGVYGANYFRHVRGSLNHIPAIGEGMAMVDLSGLSVEPVFLGMRFAPDTGPVNLYLRECFRALAMNNGSRFRGPRSFFYEAQETLRDPYREKFRPKRERIICDLLSRRDEIREVILYEAADWTYFIPISDVDYTESRFLDRCGEVNK